MKRFFRYFHCKEFFLGTILVTLFLHPATAEVDDRSNKSLESRLHNIYEQHYSREVLDADWFKVIQAVQEQTYSVKKGDTLWGISTLYFGDGNYWSKLWSVNKNITNPHLIYNGDNISFTTGSFSQPPSISITKNENGEQAVSSAAPPAEDGDDLENATEVIGSNTDENLNEAPRSSGLEGPNDLPAFFKQPYDKNKRSQNITSIVARPEVIPISDITLTQEILSSPPQIICRIKSMGLSRVITPEEGLVILDCRDQAPAIGATLSILDSNIEEIQDGHIIKVIGVVKVLKAIDKNLYEAAVMQQYDAILTKSLASPYIPSVVSVDDSGEVKQLPIKLLNADTKSIWTTGDYVFMKMTGTPANVGDILSFSNKFDYHINSFLRTARVKIVSTQSAFATGVVIDARSALREDSVSAPTESDSWFF